MHPEEKIAQLGLSLPPAATPAAAYIPFVQSGNLLFLSGHIPKRNGQVVVGQLGRTMQTAEAKQVAREVTVDLLGTLKAAVGDLGRIQRIVKVMGLVNSTPDFLDHPKVINGYSDLLAEVFGDAGIGARSAVGMGSLPGNIAVEIEVILEVEA